MVQSGGLISSSLAMTKRRNASRMLLLVDPPQHGLLEGLSSGLVALANHVRMKLPALPLKVLDFALATDEQMVRQIRQCTAQRRGQIFVGVTATTASYQSALRVVRLLKAIDPSSVVILGGPHATAQDEVILAHQPHVDFVIRGEGETGLVALLREYPDVRSVPNLSFRRDLRNIERNELAPFLDQAELDRLPATFDGSGQVSRSRKFGRTTYVSARGCPLKCSFCSVASQRIRCKSVDAVIRDLRMLVGQFGFRSIAIEDNFFAHSPARTLELCSAIAELRSEMSFSWDCQTRVESCARNDVLEAMERAGCEAVYLGVESFDPEQLLYLGKTRQPGSYLGLVHDKVVPWLLQSGIACYINLQLGLPGEAHHHRANTFRFLGELGQEAVDAGKEITIFPQLHVVYPGTGHFHEGLIEGRFGPAGESVFERFTSWESRQRPLLRWLGQHFAHGTGGMPEGILSRDRLLYGEFELDARALADVVNYVDKLESVPGITVFRYERFLAVENSELDQRIC